MLFGEPELGRQVLADDVPIQQRDGAAPDLQQLGHQHIGDGRFPRAREPGEEDREALAVPWWIAAAQLPGHLGKREPAGYLPSLPFTVTAHRRVRGYSAIPKFVVALETLTTRSGSKSVEPPSLETNHVGGVAILIRFVPQAKIERVSSFLNGIQKQVPHEYRSR